MKSTVLSRPTRYTAGIRAKPQFGFVAQLSTPKDRDTQVRVCCSRTSTGTEVVKERHYVEAGGEAHRSEPTRHHTSCHPSSREREAFRLHRSACPWHLERIGEPHQSEPSNKATLLYGSRPMARTQQSARGNLLNPNRLSKRSLLS